MKSTHELLNDIKSERSLNDILEDANNLSFSEYCNVLLNKYHKEIPEVVSKSGLDQRYCYKILNGDTSKPNKDKVIRIALALSCTLDETSHLLSLANAGGLYAQNKRDIILIKGINEKMSVMDVDLLLEKFRFQTLK